MCSLQSLTCLQVQVLPRQGMVGPSSDSRPWSGETLAGASSAVNGRACRRRRAVGGDWPAALANVQAATLRENCRPEIGSFSEANEYGNSEPPNHDSKGQGSHDRGISHQANWSADGVEVAACRDSMTKQRREGEANGPQKQRPASVSCESRYRSQP